MPPPGLEVGPRPLSLLGTGVGISPRFDYIKYVNAYFNEKTKLNLTPVFNQYLRYPAIPTLELKFDEAAGAVTYRWKVDEQAFAMPVKVGTKGQWQTIRPTAEWQTMKTLLKKSEFEVATDLYYINLS